MKRFLCGVAAFSMLFSACQEFATEDVIKTDGVTVLKVELPSTETPRTELGEKVDGNYPVYWSQGDKIVVNGIESEAVQIDPTDPRKATYQINGVLDLPYKVTYPYTHTTSEKQPQVMFPVKQFYKEGTFEQGAAPMCGYKATTSDALKLRHLAGVFCFAIKGEDDDTVLETITIRSEKPLSGVFDVDCQNGTILATDDCDDIITYTMLDEFKLSTSKERLAFITLPYGDLGICHITFTAADGRVLKAKAKGSNVEPGVVKRFSLVFKNSEVESMLDDMYETEGEWNTGEDDSNIRGYVRSNGKGLKNVVVSDGFTSTKTNSNGYYSLKSDLANVKFVSVSIPSGYSAPTDKNGLPIFYHRVTDKERSNDLCKADFSFSKISGDANRFTLLVAADPQPRPRDYGYDKIAYHSLDCCEDLYRDMREKAATITDRNVYGLMLGDIVHEEYSLFDTYIAGLKTLGFPMFNILGNHDNDPKAATDVEARHWFEEKLGPTYYSFNIGNVHFVVLDNLVMKLDGSELTGTEQGLTDEIMAWLESDLSYVDKSKILMVAAHSPMTKLRTGGSRKGALHFNDYTGLFKQFAQAHIWSGHTHKTFNYNYPESNTALYPIEEHTVVRSTGELWTNEYEAGGTPRGYVVVDVDGNNVSWKFKPTIYQSSSFTSTKIYTSKQPSYTHRDWNYKNGYYNDSYSYVAKMKSNNSVLSEDYQMKLYAPGTYHDTIEAKLAGEAANDYIYANIFMWDSKWQKPTFNGQQMEQVAYNTAYELAEYEIINHYSTYGYKLKENKDYWYEFGKDYYVHTLFRIKAPSTTGSGTVCVVDRFGNTYSSTISW